MVHISTQLLRIPLPTPESLAHRARISRLVSPLRRVRPRVPFYDLAAHRVPTLWTLYRGLMREAPGANIRFRVRMLFRQNEHLTSPVAARAELLKGHKWLDIFQKARGGDTKLQHIVARYERILQAKREKERWKDRFREQLKWQQKLRNRPIMTGAYLRPSAFNRALPRLKPQPIHISGMIHRRRKARERRMEHGRESQEWQRDLKREAEFETALSVKAQREGTAMESVYAPHHDQWMEPIKAKYETILQTYRLDEARLHSPYPPALLAQIKQARRERWANKTRELERERRGEVVARTMRRRRQAPPADVLARMSGEERRMDKVARSVSEVGYVAQVKRRLGHKIRDEGASKREDGAPEANAGLDDMLGRLRAENERRRQSAEDN
ncbi:hypothetical protein FIBSPDRAFT_860637 [Athelia psychrophila]|uniref:Uncharacterized protein n=1 Tax=Athelia psychrophila TaxID=1759441 RepID=A0A166K2F8_9AGAM|nr:hypothetical protein FIBSPDRAFT_860637 [Fibularhizoctonia sp. CBS 109695]